MIFVVGRRERRRPRRARITLAIDNVLPRDVVALRCARKPELDATSILHRLDRRRLAGDLDAARCEFRHVVSYTAGRRFGALDRRITEGKTPIIEVQPVAKLSHLLEIGDEVLGAVAERDLGAIAERDWRTRCVDWRNRNRND